MVEVIHTSREKQPQFLVYDKTKDDVYLIDNIQDATKFNSCIFYTSYCLHKARDKFRNKIMVAASVPMSIFGSEPTNILSEGDLNIEHLYSLID
jgi:hypothetical protein